MGDGGGDGWPHYLSLIARDNSPQLLANMPFGPATSRRAVTLIVASMLVSAPLAAQAKPPVKAKAADTSAKKMDGMSGMDHNMHMMPGKKMEEPKSGWKEMDDYHALVAATWHPAKEFGDMAPIRAKAKEMAAAAKTLAASKPPAACNKPALKEAAVKLAPETQAIADMVANNASNNALKDALKVLHDHFDVLEEGCAPMKGMKH